MEFQAKPADLSSIEEMREEYRTEANCQIVTDSILWRGMADPYLIFIDGKVSGYGGVWNKHFVGRVMEFYTLPEARCHAQPMFRELLKVSEATHVEAQTNLPLMLTMLHDFAEEITEENILFHDYSKSNLNNPGGTLRPVKPGDKGPQGEWVIELDSEVVAAGGVLDHYNPPYGDIYMEVAEHFRGKGYGSYIIQELKRVCLESEKTPAARCDPDNIASRQTLEKAGMLPCARLLSGKVTPALPL
jgi:GNAT superfamily N-acetyltransferase